MAAYLDLMAFAKGAELANQQNWSDTIKDISTRAGEEQLRQSQDLFNLEMPLKELSAGKKLEDFQGNQLSFDFQSSLNKELAGMAPEERGAYQAQSVLAALKNLDLTRPGSQAYQKGLVEYGTKAVSDLVKAGRFEDANALARALPGVSNTDRLLQAQQYMQPGALNDDITITAAGGKPLPNGRVNFGGVEMDRLEFAQIQARRAEDPSFNPLSALAEIDKRNKDIAFQNDVATRAKAMGMEVMVNPVTGQRVVLPRAQALQAQATGALVPAAAPQAAARPAAPAAAPQAGAPAAAPAFAQPAAGGFMPAPVAPDYWNDPSGAGLAGAIMAQPNATSDPGWLQRLLWAFSDAPRPASWDAPAPPPSAAPVASPVGVNPGWVNFMNQQPAAGAWLTQGRGVR